jgi:hypothetical protein
MGCKNLPSIMAGKATIDLDDDNEDVAAFAATHVCDGDDARR